MPHTNKSLPLVPSLRSKVIFEGHSSLVTLITFCPIFDKLMSPTSPIIDIVASFNEQLNIKYQTKNYSICLGSESIDYDYWSQGTQHSSKNESPAARELKTSPSSWLWELPEETRGTQRGSFVWSVCSA